VSLPEDIDATLWVRTVGCEEPDYLFGNPHTFPGRMHAYCPHESRDYAVSFDEIVDCSNEARWWAIGYLAGNEPAPPRTAEGDYVAPDDPRFQRWSRAAREFRARGVWPADVDSV
jgi:hypothetical protein